MISKSEAKELINDLFEEEALVIGGLVAVHKVDDDIVWRLIRNIDAIRRKFLKRLEEEDPDDDGGGPPRRPNLNPHPAIEEFLLSVRRG
ncbi:MAG: hypothetical protein IH577_01855 [Deltaproteobacteria bacterium]|nr:hypothetical protein [Deltaproteobacteria bacterium]